VLAVLIESVGVTGAVTDMVSAVDATVVVVTQAEFETRIQLT
jgi:hypothetical protein